MSDINDIWDDEEDLSPYVRDEAPRRSASDATPSSSPAPADLTETAALSAAGIEAICRAVCKVEGIDPDELMEEWETVGYRQTDPNWTRYVDAVAGALSAAPTVQPARARIIPYTAEDDATPDPAMNGLVMLAIGQDGDVPDHVLDRIPAEAADTLIRLLSAARAVAPAGVPEHAANVARTLGEFADALDADEPLNTENLIDAMRDAVDALLSPTPTPTAQGQDTLGKVRQAIADMHHAYDRRESASLAGIIALGQIQDALEMHWVQGAELARRSSAPSTSAGEAK